MKSLCMAVTVGATVTAPCLQVYVPTERIGLTLDLFDWEQISVSIHTGKQSSFLCV